MTKAEWLAAAFVALGGYSVALAILWFVRQLGRAWRDE